MRKQTITIAIIIITIKADWPRFIEQGDSKRMTTLGVNGPVDRRPQADQSALVRAPLSTSRVHLNCCDISEQLNQRSLRLLPPPSLINGTF